MVISILSGKGGTGKSTICARLSKSLAVYKPDKSVLAVDLDIGLASLDMIFNLQDKTVFNLGDVLLGRCGLEKAIVPHGKIANLSLISAPAELKGVEISSIIDTLKLLKDKYDYIFLDLPAGLGLSVIAAKEICDLNIAVTVPEQTAMRDAKRLIALISEHTPTKLIINRVCKTTMELNAIPSLDFVIDSLGVPLLGVLPEDRLISAPASLRKKSKVSILTNQAFKAISARLCGEYTPLVVHNIKQCDN